jgi:hypothetical protein
MHMPNMMPAGKPLETQVMNLRSKFMRLRVRFAPWG